MFGSSMCAWARKRSYWITWDFFQHLNPSVMETVAPLRKYSQSALFLNFPHIVMYGIRQYNKRQSRRYAVNFLMEKKLSNIQFLCLAARMVICVPRRHAG